MNAPKEKYKKTLRARYLREMRILLLKSMSLPGGQRKRQALQVLSLAFPRILAVLVLLLGVSQGHTLAAPLAPESPAPHPARAGQSDPGTVVLGEGSLGSSGAMPGAPPQGGSKAERQAERQAERERLFEESLEALLPVAPKDVERFLEARDALEGATEPGPASMRNRTRVLEAGVRNEPTLVRLTRGYSSTLLFQDVTGAPWPVLSVILGDPGAFALTQPKVGQVPVTGNAASKDRRAVENVHSHIVNIVPLTNHTSSNLVLTLEGADYPIVLHLVTESVRSKGRTSDALTVFRIGRSGPNARTLPLGPEESGVSDELLAFVHGIAPAGAKRLGLEPADGGIEVWEYKGMLYVRSVFQAVWPAWTASAAMEGHTLYVMPKTPSLVFSREGKRQSHLVKGLAYGADQ